MNRDSGNSIIPKIILILGALSVVGIILLFFRPGLNLFRRTSAPETTEELFAQVIAAAGPEILKLWEEGDRYLNIQINCPEEIIFDPKIGRSYYQCQPHLWECYWKGGLSKNPEIEINLYGEDYHVRATPSFSNRHYRPFKRESDGINLQYGHIVELEVRELSGFKQPMILSDTCRDVYLPERIYGYGRPKDSRNEGFIWDNFDRRIFIDKFYVSNQKVNEWRWLTKQDQKIIADPKLWPEPALLDLKEQKAYCHFYGKRLLEAQLFDAATMTPGDLKNPLPDRVMRPQTPWQRDLSKTFLGTARINVDYQLTPLDCQLAQVEGCSRKLFTTDSVSWMGMNFGIGFFPESFVNRIENDKNLKMSSRLLPPASEWHELAKRSSWNGEQSKELPVAFRCYEEVAP